jgi:hypothetical protein
MILEDIIGQKFDAEIIEDSGAAGGLIRVNDEEIEFVVGKIEEGQITYSPNIKSGKKRIRINQIDTSNKFRIVFADLVNPLPIHDISKEVQTYISDSKKIQTLEEFTTKYHKLEEELAEKSEDEKREKTIDKLRKKYFTAKEDMLQRFEKEKTIREYQNGTIRNATLDDLLTIETLALNFYNNIVMRKENIVEVNEMIEDAKKNITTFYILENNQEAIGMLTYRVIKNIPFIGAIGIKDHHPKTVEALLNKTMEFVSCNGFFKEIFSEIEDQEFYRKTGFRINSKYKEYSEMTKKEMKKQLLYFPPNTEVNPNV